MEFSIEIIQEAEFIPLADKASQGILSFSACFSEKSTARLTKKNFVALVKESIELEDFLDDHGARSNKNWLYYGEIVASLRGFAGSAYMINHILSRLKFYDLPEKNIDDFMHDADKQLVFLNKSIIALLNEFSKEARRLGLTIPKATMSVVESSDLIVVKVLPNNRDQEDVSDIHEYIFRISSKLVDAVNESQDVLIEKQLAKKKLYTDLIPERINEETLRHIEMHVHNAQSMYDTYIQKTTLESETPQLRSLRGYISVSLHLLGIAKELTHFYERHESSIRQEASHKRIALLIKQNDVYINSSNLDFFSSNLFLNF